MVMPIAAVNTSAFDAGSISGNGWKLEGVKFVVVGFNQKKPQVKFTAKKLSLPKPFNDLSVADIQCHDFTWNQDEVNCNQGKASVQSAYWQSPSTQFSFRLTNKNSIIRLQDARLMGSRLTLEAEADAENWRCKFWAKQVSDALINKLLELKPPSAKQKPTQKGLINLQGTLSGQLNTINHFNVTTDINGLTDQTQDGTVASENLNVRVQLEGKKTVGNQWLWRSQSQITGGALYVDPVYLESGPQPITLDAQGLWNTKTKQADIQDFTYQHPGAGALSGNATGYYHDGFHFDKANVILQSSTLQQLATVYASPFFTESPINGMTLSGNVQGKISFDKQLLTDAAVQFSKLNTKDSVGRLAINDGTGTINWSADPLQTKTSTLSWQHLAIKGFPIKTASLKLASNGNQFRLTEKVMLPFLSGMIAVNKFTWQHHKNEEPDIAFAGSISNLNLEQLTKKLGWTTLSGKISGQIPGVHYHNNTLSLDGGLTINVFDGIVKLNHLASSGLFSDFPKLTGEIEIQNLDLDKLTQKVEFGNITGRLSGFVNKLELENWHPVTFFAWLGTPDDDDSDHWISQKAVKNIASIGGGVASDLFSRGFLSFFETFRYDKIGMGCYLHGGVCQLMGLETKDKGYYLIKGGLPPRIDVVGYNSRLNWDVLVERLSRAASPDKVIVE